MGWLGKSFTGMLCMMPFMLAFNFYNKNFGIRSELVVLAWQAGTCIGIGIWGTRVGLFSLPAGGNFFWPLLAMLIIGIVFGTIANILFSQAVILAPNPALPFAINNSASAVVYVLAVGLALILPQYFSAVSFRWAHLAGVVMVIAGLSLIIK